MNRGRPNSGIFGYLVFSHSFLVLAISQPSPYFHIQELQTGLSIIYMSFKGKKCPSVKVAMNGTSASIYQFGSGREFCDVTIRTDPKLRINLFAEFFNTGLFVSVFRYECTSSDC